MQNLIDHLSVGAADLAAAKDFYVPVLQTLGIRLLAETPAFLAFGEDGPQFLVMLPHDGDAASAGNGVHVAFRAAGRSGVDAFYDVALEVGGRCAGAPGTRPGFPGDPEAYMAFIRDPFGNKLEAIAAGFAA